MWINKTYTNKIYYEIEKIWGDIIERWIIDVYKLEDELKKRIEEATKQWYKNYVFHMWRCFNYNWNLYHNMLFSSRRRTITFYKSETGNEYKFKAKRIFKVKFIDE